MCAGGKRLFVILFLSAILFLFPSGVQPIPGQRLMGPDPVMDSQAMLVTGAMGTPMAALYNNPFIANTGIVPTIGGGITSLIGIGAAPISAGIMGAPLMSSHVISPSIGMGATPVIPNVMSMPMIASQVMTPAIGVGATPIIPGIMGAPLMASQGVSPNIGLGVHTLPGLASMTGLGIPGIMPPSSNSVMSMSGPVISLPGFMAAFSESRMVIPGAMGIPSLIAGISNPTMGMAMPVIGMPEYMAMMPAMPFMGISVPMMGMPNPIMGMQSPMMGMLNPMMNMPGPIMGMQSPMMGMPNPMMVMPWPMMGMPWPMMGMPWPMMGMPWPMMGMPGFLPGLPQQITSPLILPPVPLILPPPLTPAATTPVRTANVVLVPFGGDSCIFCHSDLLRMTDLGHPEFYFVLADVQAQTGMPATCVDCHLGNPADFTVAGAHAGLLGLLVMRSQYSNIVRRSEITGPEYDLVRSIASIRASNPPDPRLRLRVQSPFRMLLWHDRNLTTASWNPGYSMQTCGQCHPAEVAEFNTTEMGQVLTMSQYIPWIEPPAPGLPGTHLRVAPQSCGLWTASTLPPNYDAFTDENRLLYNSTSTRIASQFLDPLYPETSVDPLTRLQSLSNQRNCNTCHPSCLDCHYAPFEENIPAAMGPGVKPAGTHTVTGRPLIMNCMSMGRGQFCHSGATERRRGDGYMKGDFAHVPPPALQTPETVTYLNTPDIHYNGDGLPANASCVDCHGPLGVGGGGGGGGGAWIHGDMLRNPEPARCRLCHPAVVAAWLAGTHRNLTCGACHTTKVVGYAFNFWAPGSRFGITPHPLDRHEQYAVNAMTPMLLLDENGMWAPYHVMPHLATHIDPLYLLVENYLSPRILWRNQPDIGITRQHLSKDGVAVTGSYDGALFGRDEGQVMLFLNIDKIAHSNTSMLSALPPRTCAECHTPTGTQRIPVSCFAWRGDLALAYEGLSAGTYDIVADGLGLRIENLNGGASNALVPMTGKWAVPGSYVIPPALGPSVGHPIGVL